MHKVLYNRTIIVGGREYREGKENKKFLTSFIDEQSYI